MCPYARAGWECGLAEPQHFEAESTRQQFAALGLESGQPVNAGTRPRSNALGKGVECEMRIVEGVAQIICALHSNPSYGHTHFVGAWV